MNYLTNGATLGQAVEAGVDLVERKRGADQFIDGQFAGLVQANQAWNIAARHGGTHEGATQHFFLRDQRDSGNGELTIGAIESNCYRGTTHAGRIEGLGEHIDIADRVEGVGGATVREVANGFEQFVAIGLQGVVRAEAFGEFEFGRQNINGDDGRRASQFRAHNCTEADTTESEDHDWLTGFDFSSIDNRANTSQDAAAKESGLIQWDRVIYFDQRFLGGDGIFRESGDAEKMRDMLTLVCMKARCATEKCACSIGATPFVHSEG